MTKTFKEKVALIWANHYWAIILSLFVGLVSIAPLIYFIHSVPNYSGIGFFASGGEFYYMDRMQEAYDGHLLLGNPFFADKSVPFLVPGLSEAIFAGLARLFFLSIPAFNLLSKFLFPAVIFLMIYLLTYRLSGDRRASVLSACLVLLGYEFFDPALINFFNINKASDDFLAYSRPISPQINCFFLFLPLFFAFWLSTVETKKLSWKISVAGGILLSSAFYAYVYFWTFLLVFFPLYGLYWLAAKNWDRAKAFFTVVLVGLIVSIPYWIDFWLAVHNPAYPDAAMRVGLISSHAFTFSKLLFLDMLAILFVWPPKRQAARLWSLMAVIASWAVINQQVITGRTMLIGHYHWYIVKPLTSIIFAICLVYVLDRSLQFSARFFDGKKWTKLANLSRGHWLSGSVIVLFAICLFTHAVFVQAQHYLANYPDYVKYQRYGPVIDYLNKNFPGEQTVWAPAPMSDILPAFSRHNSFNSRDAANYLVSADTLKQQVFLSYRLKGVDPDHIMTELKANALDTIVRIYQQGYLLPELNAPNVLPDLAKQYDSYYGNSLQSDLNYFKTDLVVWDDQANGPFVYGSDPLFRRLKDFPSGITVYGLAGH